MLLNIISHWLRYLLLYRVKIGHSSPVSLVVKLAKTKVTGSNPIKEILWNFFIVGSLKSLSTQCLCREGQEIPSIYLQWYMQTSTYVLTSQNKVFSSACRSAYQDDGRGHEEPTEAVPPPEGRLEPQHLLDVGDEAPETWKMIQSVQKMLRCMHL